MGWNQISNYKCYKNVKNLRTTGLDVESKYPHTGLQHYDYHSLVSLTFRMSRTHLRRQKTDTDGTETKKARGNVNCNNNKHTIREKERASERALTHNKHKTVSDCVRDGKKIKQYCTRDGEKMRGCDDRESDIAERVANTDNESERERGRERKQHSILYVV